MEQRRGFEQQIQLAQASGGLRAAHRRYASQARQHALDNICAFSEAKDNLAAIFDAKINHVAGPQALSRHLFAVDKNSLAMAAVLQPVAAFLCNQGGAVARDAPVLKLQMIAGLAAAADQKWGLSYQNKLTRTAGDDDLQHGFIGFGIVRHGNPGCADCSIPRVYGKAASTLPAD